MNKLERYIAKGDSAELTVLKKFGCSAKLENSLRHFNIFDCLGVSDFEIRHSNFLAWLLDLVHGILKNISP